MKSLYLIIILLVSLKLTSQAQTLPLIPYPSQVITKAATCAIARDKVTYGKVPISLQKAIPMFNMPIHKMQKGIPISFIIQDGKTENYTLDIGCREIKISGTETGCFYALQSLQQLFDNNNGNIPCVKIVDTPRFGYRGMHLDVCRHFFTVDEVKKYISYLAAYKFNTFHWHLTDDQGWRIQIKKYPFLTSIGSRRKQTLIGKQKDEKGTGNYDNKAEEGFYTQEQIKDIVEFAAINHITIIPEIEMPGHSLAAVAAYPWLSCDGKAVEVGTRWGVYEQVYCAGKDSVFTFMEDVLQEVMDLFPSKYIHIGGDEVVKDAWKKCPKCQGRIKTENLKDEHGLQSYFITRIEKFLNKNDRALIGWDEILEGGLSPNATVMSWRGEDGGIEAAKQSHDVIMTPGKPLYFDHSQNKLQDEPLNIGGNNSYQSVYNYNPLPKQLSSDQQKYILGAQANVWTEYIPNFNQVEYMIFPRMQALSEALWSPIATKNIDSFNARLFYSLRQLDRNKITFRYPEPIGFKDSMTLKEFTTTNFTSLVPYYIIEKKSTSPTMFELLVYREGDSKKNLIRKFKIVRKK